MQRIYLTGNDDKVSVKKRGRLEPLLNTGQCSKAVLMSENLYL